MWRGTVFGESQVIAENEDEARKMAEEGKDFDFERTYDDPDWENDQIEFIEKLEE